MDAAPRQTVTPVASDHAAVPVPPPLIYAAGLLAGMAAERVSPSPDLPKDLARPVGVLTMGAGAALIASSAGLFRRSGTSVMPVRPTTVLVGTGPYRFTRNPMYVGMACLHAGLALRMQATWSLVLLAPVLLTVDRVVIAREERYLERAFGDQYRRYRTRVRRWV